MKNIQVFNINSTSSLATQFIIKTKTTEYFQSYASIIAKKTKNGKIYLDADKWNYSRTTSKYRNIFLNETIAETKKKIKSGEYKLINLN